MVGPAGDDIDMPPGPFLRTSPRAAALTVIAVVASAALATGAVAGVRRIVDGRCKAVPSSTVQALDRQIRIPVARGPGPASIGHGWVGLKQADVQGLPGVHYLAGYIDAPGGRVGPAVWRVIDPGAPRLDQLEISAANELAGRLTPNLGTASQQPIPEALTKALECARDALT